MSLCGWAGRSDLHAALLRGASNAGHRIDMTDWDCCLKPLNARLTWPLWNMSSWLRTLPMRVNKLELSKTSMDEVPLGGTKQGKQCWDPGGCLQPLALLFPCWWWDHGMLRRGAGYGDWATICCRLYDGRPGRVSSWPCVGSSP
jgi:hypothetical protein